MKDFEIGQVRHWKPEIGNLELDCTSRRVVQFKVSNLGFPMPDSSNFKIVPVRTLL